MISEIAELTRVRAAHAQSAISRFFSEFRIREKSPVFYFLVFEEILFK